MVRNIRQEKNGIGIENFGIDKFEVEMELTPCLRTYISCIVHLFSTLVQYWQTVTPTLFKYNTAYIGLCN